MALTSRADSVCLLDAAVDAGLTHLDVARSYGYGEAQSALGDLPATRRSDVTVARKLGIAGLGPAVITHSVGAGATVACARPADARVAVGWEVELFTDPRDPALLASLLLAAALRRNEDGIVLCSSRDPRHIAANARMAADGPAEQIDAFAASLARDATYPA